MFRTYYVLKMKSELELICEVFYAVLLFKSFFRVLFLLLISFLSSHVRKEHKHPSMKPSPTNFFKHSFDIIWLCHIIMDTELQTWMRDVNVLSVS
jgi:hypothetical protein